MNIIFDIDGVLADNAHRAHFITGDKKDWDAYYGALGQDPVIEPVAEVLKLFGASFTHCIILCTGRPEKHRFATENWLIGANLDWHVDKIFMRPDDDFRPNPVLKDWHARCVMDRFGPIGMVFEDDERSVKEWLKYCKVVNHVKGSGING